MPETNDVISHLYYDLNDKIDGIDARVGDTETRLDNIDIAEATEPKVYVASLTQSGTNAPVATVLKNTLGGTVVWAYDAVGEYVGTLAGAFLAGKVATYIPSKVSNQDLISIKRSLIRNSDNNVILNTAIIDYSTPTEAAFSASNDMLDDTLIKIEVYP